MSAKELRLRPIPSRDAREFIRRHHYSGKVVNNSQINVGVYWRGRLEGVMTAGPPTDRRRVLHLVTPSEWNSVIELNRMAFTEALPRNSESRALSVFFRLLRKHAPNIKWVLSFADASQCGDGTIYRAAGFTLTGIKPNSSLCRLPDGRVMHSIALAVGPNKPRPELGGKSYLQVTGGTYSFKRYVEAAGAEVIPGYQLRYIKLLDPDVQLNVPAIPYERIDQLQARMYRGQRGGSLEGRGSTIPGDEGGSIPTPPLQ